MARSICRNIAGARAETDVDKTTLDTSYATITLGRDVIKAIATDSLVLNNVGKCSHEPCGTCTSFVKHGGFGFCTRFNKTLTLREHSFCRTMSCMRLEKKLNKLLDEYAGWEWAIHHRTESGDGSVTKAIRAKLNAKHKIIKLLKER